MKNPIAYGDNVRTFTDKTHKDQDYEVVEELVGHGTSAKWVERKRFGHQSDDYALTNVRQYAQALARQNIGGH